jgi:hypothetical protein
MRRYFENLVLLTLGIATALVGAFFPIMPGHLFRNGAPAVIAVFLIVKGASSLRCRRSDIVLGTIAFVLVLLSKIVPASAVSPVAFHVAALCILPLFAMTGLTFKAIVSERRKRKESGRTIE